MDKLEWVRGHFQFEEGHQGGGTSKLCLEKCEWFRDVKTGVGGISGRGGCYVSKKFREVIRLGVSMEKNDGKDCIMGGRVKHRTRN